VDNLDLEDSKVVKPHSFTLCQSTVFDWDGETRLFRRRKVLSLNFLIPPTPRPLRTYSEVNLDRLQHWIDMGRIDPKEPITVAVLLKSGCIPSLRDGVALLAQVGLICSPFSSPHLTPFIATKRELNT
jgi:hypothetical protein